MTATPPPRPRSCPTCHGNMLRLIWRAGLRGMCPDPWHTDADPVSAILDAAAEEWAAMPVYLRPVTCLPDAEPVVIAIDLPGDGDPGQEAGDLAACLTEALPEETLSHLTALLLTEMATRTPWHRILRMVSDAADAAAPGGRSGR